MTRKVEISGFSVLCFATALVPGFAETLSLEPNADTALLEYRPDFNLGAQDDLPAGTLGAAAGNSRSRMLLRFDLSPLPSGARIESAEVRLTVTRYPDGGGANTTFGLHRVLRPWSEGIQHGGLPGGAVSAPGESSWFQPNVPSEPWSGPGGRAGEDFAEDPSSTERILGLGTYAFEFGPDGLAEIQQWADQPDTNLGWMLRGQSESVPRSARRFGAREHLDAAKRPRLVLEYSVGSVPEAPRLTALERAGSTSTVHFSAQPDVRYTLEFSDQAGPRDWQPLTPPIMTNTAGPLSLSDDSGPAPWRLYRVAARPGP